MVIPVRPSFLTIRGPLPPFRLATSAPVAAAPPAMARIAISFALMPAAAEIAFVCEMTVLAFMPWWLAETLIWNCPAVLLGTNPLAIACPLESV